MQSKTKTKFDDLPAILRDNILETEINKILNKEKISNKLCELNFIIKTKYDTVLFDDKKPENAISSLEDKNIKLEYMFGKLSFYISQNIIRDLALILAIQEKTSNKIYNMLSEIKDTQKPMSIIVDDTKLITNNNDMLKKELTPDVIAVSNLLMSVIKDFSPYLIDICIIYKEAEQEALNKLNQKDFYLDENLNIIEDKKLKELKMNIQNMKL